tara:strand:- start:126 stop:335 length:210 start_codon:yes stop_codon:yes gene_type:complete
MVFKELIFGTECLGCPVKNSWLDQSPRLGLSTKEITEIVKDRMMVEVASSNSGVLASSAFSEMASFLNE